MLAEIDDDLGSLEIPGEEPKPMASPQKDTESDIDPSASSESQAEAPPTSKAMKPESETDISSKALKASLAKPAKQTYPLYPSIVQLLHERGLDASEAGRIPASGPKGRLLKGDVLAYLGRISSSYASEQSQRIAKLGCLNLENVQVVPPPRSERDAPKATDGKRPAAASEQEPSTPEDTEIAVSISMQKVFEVQKRIHTTLGTTLPISTFIARATELANDDLPRASSGQVSANELFNAILGLDRVDDKVSRGHYVPQITALSTPATPKTLKSKKKEADVIDILTTNSASSMSPSSARSVTGEGRSPNTVDTENVFSVIVSKGEEKRARVFLERMKTILQLEPGRLIL